MKQTLPAIHPAALSAAAVTTVETVDDAPSFAPVSRNGYAVAGGIGLVMLAVGLTTAGSGFVSFLGLLLLLVAAIGWSSTPTMVESPRPRGTSRKVILSRLTSFATLHEPRGPEELAIRDYALAYVALMERGDPIDRVSGLAEEISALLDVRLKALRLAKELRESRRRLIDARTLETEIEDLRSRRDAARDEVARRQWATALTTAENRLLSVRSVEQIADRLDAQIETIRQETRHLYETFARSSNLGAILPATSAPTVRAFTESMRKELDDALAAVAELDGTA